MLVISRVDPSNHPKASKVVKVDGLEPPFESFERLGGQQGLQPLRTGGCRVGQLQTGGGAFNADLSTSTL